MDQSTNEIRLANWKAIINECQSRPTDQTKKQWLKEHDVPIKSYYYWLRKIRQSAYDELSQTLPAVQERNVPAPAFVEIPAEAVLQDTAPATPAITIRTGRSTIEISSSVPESTILKLVKAVSNAL